MTELAGESRTGPLRRLLDWRRERRWRLERAAMYAGADVLVISRTKSGRTWLRVMLSHLYHLRYGAPPDELLRFDNFHRLAPTIPRIHFSHDTTFAHHRPAGRPLQAADRQKLLFLVRDPRDVAVSFHFHVRHRAPDRELQHKGIPASARQLPLEDFVLDERFGAPQVIGFLNKWWIEAERYPTATFLRYEDLRADTAGELGRIAAFLGHDFSADELAKAVAFASFEQLRERERSGFFNSGRLAPVRPEDPDSYKVRRGRVGGYREAVSSRCAAALDRLVAERLEPGYGYGAQGATAPLARGPGGAQHP
ncbi:MAG TPA: sulfotransferase domain-containing protein [Geminicoccaceae bacterium]